MESLLRRAARLHSASGVAQTVIEITSSEDFDLRELAACIEIDPALTSRVLTHVNAVRHGFVGRVSNVPQAVMLLGRHAVRNIALTFCVVEAFTQGIPSEVYTDFWSRSLTTSLTASRLASRARVAESDAYTAGLLADLGVLVLAQFETDRYLPLFAQHTAHDLPIAERELFGFDHAELSSRLLDTWNFPPMVSLAVAAHHDDEEAARVPLASVVRAGNLMPAAIWESDGYAFGLAHAWCERQFKFDTKQFVTLALEVNEAVTHEAELYRVKGIEKADPEQLEREAWQIIGANCRMANSLS